MVPDARYWVAMDRLLADLSEFLAKNAWTDLHDESQDLYERIRVARELLAEPDEAASIIVRGAP